MCVCVCVCVCVLFAMFILQLNIYVCMFSRVSKVSAGGQQRSKLPTHSAWRGPFANKIDMDGHAHFVQLGYIPISVHIPYSVEVI